MFNKKNQIHFNFRWLWPAMLSPFIGLLAYAQANDAKITLELSPQFTVDERSIPLDIIESDSSGFYILYGGGKFGQKEKTIRRFNLDFTPSEKTFTLVPDKKDKDIDVVRIIKTDSSLLQMLAYTSRDSTRFYLQKINLPSFALEKQKFITELYNKGTLDILRMSGDTTILFHTLPFKNEEFLKIRLLMLDKNFDEINSFDFKFPYSNKVIKITDFEMTDKGEFILLTRLNTPITAESGKIVDKYNHVFFKLSAGKLKQMLIIPLGEKYMNQTMLEMNTAGELVFAGFYSENDMFAIKGTFYYLIDTETGEIIKNKMQVLDGSFFAMLAGSVEKNRILEKAAKGKFEDKYYVLAGHKFIQDKLILLAEQRHIITSNYGTTFYFQNIAVVKMDNDGGIAWATKIGKDNSETNAVFGGAFGSFIAIERDGHFYLIYNDNSLNLFHTSGPVIPAFGKERERETVICTHVDENGTYKRNILSNYVHLGGIRIRPRLSLWLDKNTLILFGQDPDNVKVQRMVKVNFPPINTLAKEE